MFSIFGKFSCGEELPNTQNWENLINHVSHLHDVCFLLWSDLRVKVGVITYARWWTHLKLKEPLWNHIPSLHRGRQGVLEGVCSRRRKTWSVISRVTLGDLLCIFSSHKLICIHWLIPPKPLVRSQFQDQRLQCWCEGCAVWNMPTSLPVFRLWWRPFWSLSQLRCYRLSFPDRCFQLRKPIW